MINPKLFKKFIQRGIVSKNTPIKADGKDLFVLEIFKTTNGEYMVVAEKTEYSSSQKLKFGIEHIEEIEGMEPNYMARAYDMKPDGSKLSTGKPRGRPKKHRTLENQ